MAKLNDEQIYILKRFKQDLSRGDLSKISKALLGEISKYDRGYIISYMLEHGINILDYLPYIPDSGVVDLERLSVLSIPGNIENIKPNAIHDNPSLQEIIIEEGVQYIHSKAIYNNPNLKNIIIPESVISVGSEAFKNNSELQEIFIPNSITVLPKGLFEGCSNNIIVKANYRPDRRNRLKCIEAERDWYKNHLKWIKD